MSGKLFQNVSHKRELNYFVEQTDEDSMLSQEMWNYLCIWIFPYCTLH